MSARETGMVRYNVQTVADIKPHLIVAHEVTNVGHDRSQLCTRTEHIPQQLGMQNVVAIANLSYFSGTEILNCEQRSAIPLISKPLILGNPAIGCSTRGTSSICDNAKITCVHC